MSMLYFRMRTTLKTFIRLLINPLFKGQRGWVNLNNAKFQSKIGAGLASSHILYHIGFACQEEPDGLRVGPFKGGSEAGSAAQIANERGNMAKMDKYMMRVWIEVTLYLLAFLKRNSELRFRHDTS